MLWMALVTAKVDWAEFFAIAEKKTADKEGQQTEPFVIPSFIGNFKSMVVDKANTVKPR